MVLLSLALLLAGCSGGGEGTAKSAGAPLSAPDAEFDENTGAIVGQVLSAEYEPLADAGVGLLGTDVQTTTALDGGFTLSHVPPGEYTLVAAKLGFRQGQATVRVEAGREADPVTLTLERVAVAEPYYKVEQFTGYITCSVGSAVLLSEECGQGLQTDVGTFGTNARNKIDWRFNLTTVEGLQDVYMELDWAPASAAATKLGFNVAHGFKCTPNCGSSMPAYCGVFKNFGPPVQRCDIPIDKLGVKDPAKDLPWDITGRAWAAPVNKTDVPVVVLEQPFTMYRTEFYDMARPEGYTAVPPD